MLMPSCIEDWLPDNHMAKFVVSVVDSLDISAIESRYALRGGTPYGPRMMLSLLFYGYSTGVFSSRKLERATFDRVDFRYITCDLHPDHDTINSFRQRFLKELKPLFTQILLLAGEMGVLKMGTVSIDGTKVKANASKHKAVSYKRATAIEKQLESEIEALLKKAEARAHLPVEDEGLSIPAELIRREDRLEKIKQAKAVIEARARQRHEEDQAQYESKLTDRERRIKSTGKKPGGKAPQPPQAGPRDKDQYNFTDPESRIMKDGASGGFEQAYNAQAAVDTTSMLIVGQHLTDHLNDKEELNPSLDSIPEEVGQPEAALADSGYFSQKAVQRCEARGVDAYIATGRTPHHKSLEARLDELRGVEPPALPVDATPKEKMAHKLQTVKGRAAYRLRKMTVEPVFGIIKEVLGFRRFHLRGLEKACGEWTLMCIGYNLKRIFALQGT